MKRLAIICVTVLTLIFQSGYTSANNPTKNELRNALSKSLPKFIELKSFDITASQNLGNEIEPIYGVRFKGLILTKENLYQREKVPKNNNDERFVGNNGKTYVRGRSGKPVEVVTWVELKTKQGFQTELFGKIISRFYQDYWIHDIKFEGNPIPELGVPLAVFSNIRYIVKGSKEEKEYREQLRKENEKYQAEKRRKEENDRKLAAEKAEAEEKLAIRNAALATKMNEILPGTWECLLSNDTFTYQTDGKLIITNEGGVKIGGTWNLKNDKLNINGGFLKGDHTYTIINCDKNTYEIEDQYGNYRKWTRVR